MKNRQLTPQMDSLVKMLAEIMAGTQRVVNGRVKPAFPYLAA